MKPQAVSSPKGFGCTVGFGLGQSPEIPSRFRV